MSKNNNDITLPDLRLKCKSTKMPMWAGWSQKPDKTLLLQNEFSPSFDNIISQPSNSRSQSCYVLFDHTFYGFD